MGGKYLPPKIFIMKRIPLLLLIILGICFPVSSQKIYGLALGANGSQNTTDIVLLDIQTCQQDIICQIVSYNRSFTMAFNPKGECYLLIYHPNSNDIWLAKYDLDNCKFIDSTKLLSYPNLSWIKFDYENNVYFADSLKYNLQSKTFYTIPNSPYLFTYLNGIKYGLEIYDNLYMRIKKYEKNDTTIVEQNVVDISKEKWLGLTSLNSETTCNNQFLYYSYLNYQKENMKLMKMNVLTKEKIDVCPNVGDLFQSICTKEEFLSSDPECDLLLDLDRDNSSGLFPYDYQSPPICFQASIPIADKDAFIRTSQDENFKLPAVDSIEFILSGIKDLGYEGLSYLGTNSLFDFKKTNDSTFVLYTKTDVADSLMRQALTSVNYINNASAKSNGLRLVKVQAISDLKRSKQVIAYLNILHKPSLPLDTILSYCTSLNISNLSNDLLILQQGYWQPPLHTPNSFNSSFDKESQYQFISIDSICGADTMLLRPLRLPSPTKILPADTAICKGLTLSLNLTTQDVITWQDGSQDLQKSLAIGQHIINLKNNAGCTNSDTILIIENTQKLKKQVDISLCENESFDFNGKKYKAGDRISYEVKNNIGCDSLIEINLNPSSFKLRLTDTTTCDDMPIFFSNKSYSIGDTIQYYKPNNQGCDSLIMQVYKAKNKKVYSISSIQDTICSGTTTPLSLVGDISSFLWSNGSTEKTIQAVSGTYSVTVTDEDACTQVLSKDINKYSSTLAIMTQDATCNEDNGVVNIIGNITGASLDGKDLQTYTITSLSSKNYALKVIDKNGCKFDTSFSIKNLDFIDIDIASSYTINQGDSIIIDAPGISSITSDNTDLYVLENKLVLKPSTSGKFIFNILDSLGCEYSKETMIEVLQKINIIVPNIIALNSNLNKRLQVFIPSNVNIIEFTIFDRWANILYTTDNVVDWDAHINGKMVATGVYLYKLAYQSNGKLFYKYGDITVTN
ncbi:MAG: hypothetical protein RLZZ546_1303 [Bacteroidota bacterium]